MTVPPSESPTMMVGGRWLAAPIARAMKPGLEAALEKAINTTETRRADPLEARARLLATEAGLDPDARRPHDTKPGRTMPTWVTWRDAARAAIDAERAEAASAGVASLRPQDERYYATSASSHCRMEDGHSLGNRLASDHGGHEPHRTVCAPEHAKLDRP